MKFIKDPDAVLDYKWDWSDWLQAGESIAASQFIVPDGLTHGTPADAHDATSATIWLTGGTAGATYRVTNRITTDQGRTDDRTGSFAVQNR